MALTERIAIIIDANARGAVRGLSDTALAAESTSRKTLGARASLQLLEKTQLSATSAGKKFSAGVNEAGTVLGGLQAAGLSAGKALGLGVAGGAIAAGSALAAFTLGGVEKFGQATAEVRQLQRTMGGTAEDASRLRYAGQRLGIDLNATARAAGLLGKSIGNGTSKLAEYGVQVARDSQGNVDMSRTIANVAEAYQSTEDPAKRAALGAAAFGRGWQALAPLLGKSRAELAEIYRQADEDHQVFDQDDLEKGRRMAAASKELNQAIQGLQIELGEGLVPVLTEVTETLSEATRAADEALGAFGMDLGDAIGMGTDAMINSIPVVGQLHQALDLFGGSSDDASDKAEKHRAAEQRKAAAVKEATTAITAETQAQLEQVGGSLAYEASLRSLADARDNYNRATLEAIAAGGKDAEKNKAASDAEFQLKQAIDSTARAAASKAQQDLGPNASAADKAKASTDAYRQSLMGAAHSDIPGMRNQALILIATLNDYASRQYNARVNLDTAEAMGKLNSLKTRWDEVAGAMGPVGPQGPRVQLRK